MFFAYILALFGIALFGATLVATYLHTGRFFGHTLSQWIQKTRLKEDETSATKLLNVRKRIEHFAHDVVKHRLLGLESLLEETHTALQNSNAEHPPLSQEQQVAFREEFFRLCGIKAKPEERLWQRWIDFFIDIYQFTGKYTAAPFIDPMFKTTHVLLLKLRALMTLYIKTERSNDLSLPNIHKLNVTQCSQTYTNLLALADACRMIINPEDIIQKAIQTLEVQTGGSGVSARIQRFGHVQGELLSSASSKVLSMCLLRLLDNALNVSHNIAIDAFIDTDEFTGIQTLVFKVYDSNEKIPSVSDYGMGLRGVIHTLNTFESGFYYRSEHREIYQKAAIIALPVSQVCDFPVTKLSWKHILNSTLILLINLIGLFGCFLFVIGGPPVEFAGRGTNVVEFPVNVGDELVIPLCKGGRNVRANVHIVNEACINDTCSFHTVLQQLTACTQSLNHPNCPGEIRWKPQFHDGQRQGKNYELTIDCIADGPPKSQDSQRIRVLVTRPNSAPLVVMTQVINETTGDIFYVTPNQPIKIGVTDKLHLNVLANDEDADTLIYRLKQPNGESIVSENGTFELKTDWSMFATSRFELEISDGITSLQNIPIVLEAQQLHPIEIQNIGIWTEQSATRQACEGSSESKICYLTNDNANELAVELWFDPLLKSVQPFLDLHTTDSNHLSIKHIKDKSAKKQNQTQIGEQWEIYLKATKQLLAIIELTNIERLNAPGQYRYTFVIMQTPATPELTNLAVNLTVSERTKRMPPLKTLLIFARQSTMHTPVSFSTRHVILSEYELEEHKEQAQASTWLYPKTRSLSEIAPVLGEIACQTPEFADAFETPVINNLQNAWRIDFKLKKGCIPGLNVNLPGKMRLCAADIQFPGKHQKQSEVIWIMLDARSCTPKIESLTLSSTKDELADNIFKWNFEIIDADGDLPIHGISIDGIQDYALELSDKNSALGSIYNGTLALETDCSNAQYNPTQQTISLKIKDNDNHEIIRPLNISPNCPPLVSTPNNKHIFHVTEGEQLAIPLNHTQDVKLELHSRFGTIINDTFIWDVSCMYGKGPHDIEIRTASESQYGKPLTLEIHIDQCQPRFNLYIDDQVLPAQTPIIMHKGTQKRLKLTADRKLENVTVIPDTQSRLPNIRLTQVESQDGWQYDIHCDSSKASDELRIEFLPNANSNPPPIDAIRIPIQCTDLSP